MFGRCPFVLCGRRRPDREGKQEAQADKPQKTRDGENAEIKNSRRRGKEEGRGRKREQKVCGWVNEQALLEEKEQRGL